MVQKFSLDRREIEEILRLMNKFDCNRVKLEESSGSGIGTTLTGYFPVIHNDEVGELQIEITGVENW